MEKKWIRFWVRSKNWHPKFKTILARYLKMQDWLFEKEKVRANLNNKNICKTKCKFLKHKFIPLVYYCCLLKLSPNSLYRFFKKTAKQYKWKKCALHTSEVCIKGIRWLPTNKHSSKCFSGTTVKASCQCPAKKRIDGRSWDNSFNKMSTVFWLLKFLYNVHCVVILLLSQSAYYAIYAKILS